MFVLAGPCGFVGRLPHSVIFGQDVVLFLEARREVRWRVEPYEQTDVGDRVFVLLQEVCRVRKSALPQILVGIYTVELLYAAEQR